MDPQLKRLALAAAFSPASGRLGRALRERSPDRHRPLDYLKHLPPAGDARLLRDPETLAPVLHGLAAHGWRWLALGDDDYPPLLADLEDAPGVLAVRGDPAVLSAPQLALVGARHASADGLDNAHRFARAFAGAGFTVTSGLALGVDGAAHQGALAGGGTTVAVLGCGPDRIYPARHAGLAERIVQGGGALVTEFAPGAGPLGPHFPLRNRVISGLSLATVVVEAALRSGSLITARTAAEQGREVFAVPGSLHNPLSKGCHRLLRDGANWLESVDDVLAAFGDFRRTVEHSPALNTTRPGGLLRHFTGGVNDLDALCRRSGLAMAELADQLAELELEGRVQRVAGGYTARTAPSRD
ncbi:DNA-processing protein DprA [Alloalcanivorax marinus]|uniref:DNA-processing protein DprA n=1 Tax=Alloalcanivorax marinus TaxID=1177169 RepID=UPI001958F748|nr:DNA-processing protein DprA [Alloalcanivorax marinus]MBM7335107.1 DNA-protecting protein DprA [Alloalcanivorax marinus]